MTGESEVLSIFILPVFTMIVSGVSIFSRRAEARIAGVSLVIGFISIVMLLYGRNYGLPDSTNTAIFLTVISLGLLVYAFVQRAFRTRRR